MAISVPPYMPIAQRHQPNINIAGSIGGLGDALIGGLEYGQKRKADRATKAAFSEPVFNADGTMNYAAMAGKIAQSGGDIDTALTLTRLAEVQAQNAWQRGQPDWQVINGSLYNLRDLGGQGGGQQGGGQQGGGQPAYPPEPDLGGGGYPPEPEQQAAAGQPEPVIRGPEPQRPRRRGLNAAGQEVDQEWTGSEWVDVSGPKVSAPKPLSATDRKAVRTAREQNVQLKSTVASLDRALELNDKIFTGAGAEARQALGTQLPDWMVPNQVASPQQAQQTEEWRSLMKPEAIAAMANSLSGATTDFELRQFVELMADPKTTPQTRRALIDRMKNLAVEKQALNEDLVREYEEGADVIAEPAAPAEVSPDSPTSPEPEGEIVESGGVRYMIMPDGTVVQLD